MTRSCATGRPRVVGGDGRLVNEIDEVVWLDVPGAHARLDYARDRDQLLALVRLHQEDRLDSWPLVLVRHAHAVPRGEYRGDDDTRRPLTAPGRLARAALVAGARAHTGSPGSSARPPSAAFAPSTRIARSAGAKVRCAPRTGSRRRATPSAAQGATHLRRLLDRGEAALLCTHGPVMPSMLDELAARLDLDVAGAVEVVEAFAEARDDKLAKGEALVCHVVGTGDAARVVAVERHLP